MTKVGAIFFMLAVALGVTILFLKSQNAWNSLCLIVAIFGALCFGVILWAFRNRTNHG